MKKLLSAVLVMVLTLSMSLPSLALTEKEKLDNINSVAQLMKDYGISVTKQDDPFFDIFRKMLADDEFYNNFMYNMLSQYDKYSLFVPAGQYDQAYPTNSSYVGVGITMEQYGKGVRIAAVNEKGSAFEAGFKVGDIIYAVNGFDMSVATLELVSEKIRGEKGTEVTIAIKRMENGKEQYITKKLMRKYIGVPNFTSEVVEEGVFYMDFTRFADTNTYIQFVFALQDMTNANTRSLILDLRGNPGGEVDMALNIINRLLPSKQTFFMTRSKLNGQYDYEFYDSDGIGAALNKIIILQDSGSASASEIIIASLKDLGYGETVGETSYGKGRGQYHVALGDGSVAVVTGIELMAPNMVDYDGVGIAPDHIVHKEQILDENGVEVLIDRQYEKALELARKYAKEPQKYTVDQYGNVTNIPQETAPTEPITGKPAVHPAE